MPGKSEYPRVGSHRKVAHAGTDADCEMCGGRILWGWGYWRVEIETHRFAGSRYVVDLCDTCWHKHKTGEILEWWLKKKRGG